MAYEWGYSEYNGPETWSKCFPAAAGTRQSPIDIQHVNLKSLNTNQRLSWRYLAENTHEISNCGYGWKVHVNGKNSALTGGPLSDKYILEQFHCHWGISNEQGSEHTVNGQRYAGELHLVHWNVTKYSTFDEAAKHPDGLCVLGVFLTPGRRHAELDKVVAQLPKIEFKGATAKIPVPINPGHFIPERSGYYTYQGSLTTPPCSECVIWIVFKEPVEVSNEQLTAFRNLKRCFQEEICPCDEFEAFVKHNFRPTVPLGQREIREYRQ